MPDPDTSPWPAHREEGAARPREIPMTTFPANYPNRSPEEATAREHYYSIPREKKKQRPWQNRKKHLYMSAILVAVTIVSCAVALTVVLLRRSGSADEDASESSPDDDMISATPSFAQPSSNSLQESSVAMTSFLDGLPSITTTIQTKVSVSTLTVSPTASSSPLSSLSRLASVFIDKGTTDDTRRLLVWQDDEGDLIFVDDGTAGSKQAHRVRDSLKDYPKPKKGTPFAAAADDDDAVHLFYVSAGNTISHIFKEEHHDWKTGSLAINRKSISVHEKTILSAAWHEGEKNTKVVVVSYQTPKGGLQLAMSESPKKDQTWHDVEFDTFTGQHPIGDWESLGHSLAGDWQNPRNDSDGEFRGLLMVVEGRKEAVPWECSVDFHSLSTKQVECHWLKDMFLDVHGRGIPLASKTSQFAWLRTGIGKDGSPATTLPYEFGFLYLSADGKIEESRVGVDLPRVPGQGFKTDTRIDAIAATSEPAVYGRSGSDLIVFKLDGDGWRWRMDGIYNTTVSE